METNTHNAFDFPLFDTTEQKGKSMPPYTDLSLFLIISSKFYISQPQNVIEQWSNHGIWQECLPWF